MKAILMSIQAQHNRNIESGKKTSELRIRPPKSKPPFKVYTYESGFDGRHKVVNEWICVDITTWRICMGIPAHLPLKACISIEEIKAYSGKCYKDIAEMKITDLKIYDKPKKLYEFFVKGTCEEEDLCSICKYYYKGNEWSGSEPDCDADGVKPLTRPPQSWCYVEEL